MKRKNGQRRRAAWVVSLLGLTALGIANTAAYAHDDDEGVPQSQVRQGFRIAPVPLDLRHKNRFLVGMGSYIVNAQGGCNDCHTFPPYKLGGDPFKGEFTVVNDAKYLAGGTPFGPGLVSRNITPDSLGRPAGLTLEEFITTLRTGRDPDNPGHILQVMPWPVYGQMTERDLRAVYEYLRSIPSLPNNY